MLTEQNAVSMGLLVYLYQKPEMGGNLRDCLQNSVKFCRGRAGLGLVGRVVPMEGMAKRRDRGIPHPSGFLLWLHIKITTGALSNTNI